jgi:hypothetical protein
MDPAILSATSAVLADGSISDFLRFLGAAQHAGRPCAVLWCALATSTFGNS